MGGYRLAHRFVDAVGATALLGSLVIAVGAQPAVAATTCNGLTVTIPGTSGAEPLTGTAGNDVIDSGGGADTINGFGGNDTICAGIGNAVIDGGGGTDTVSFEQTTAANANLATEVATGPGTQALVDIENLIGSPNSDTLTGDSAANLINGGLGSDTMDGAGGADTASFAGGAAVNASLTSATATGQGADTLASFENLSGSANSDTLTGNAFANTIVGGQGADALDGAGGADTASFAGGAAVNASLTSGTATGQGADALAHFENLTGSSHDDTLTGDPLANTIVGGQGNDTMDGAGATTDTASFTGGTAVNANLTSGSATGLGSDTLANFENLTGSSKDDTLTGNNAANTIIGGLGDDTMDGAGGLNDTASFTGSTAVGANLATGTATGLGSDTLGNFKNLTGSSAADVLTGDANNNTLSGSAGTDSCGGGGGSDHASECEIVQGSINPGGAIDTYDFKLGASQKLFLDSTAYAPTVGSLVWTFTGPAGALFTKQSVGVDVDTFATANAGTHTLTVQGSNGLATGTHSFRVVTVVDTAGPIVLNGSSNSVNLPTPGQRALFTFSGAVNQRVSFDLSSGVWSSNSCASSLRLLRPNGSQLATGAFCPNGLLDATTLDIAGTWTIVVDPAGDVTGTATLKGFTVVDQTGSIALDGIAKNLTFAAPGQRALLTFAGVVGQRVTFQFIGVSMSGSTCASLLHLLRPTGTELANTPFCPGGFLDVTTLDAKGIWTIVVDPALNITGTATLAGHSIVDQTGTIVLGGAAKSVSITQPGQRALFTFTGAVNQRVAFDLTAGSFFHTQCSSVLRLLRPNGTELTNAPFCPNGFLDPAALDVAGTWTIVVDLANNSTGTASLRGYNVVDQTGTIAVNGATKSVSITTPGQRALFTFSGTSGNFVSSHMTTGAWAPNSCGSLLRLLRPNGTELKNSAFCPNGSISSTALDATGTWTIVVDPAAASIGSATLDVTNP